MVQTGRSQEIRVAVRCTITLACSLFEALTQRSDLDPLIYLFREPWIAEIHRHCPAASIQYHFSIGEEAAVGCGRWAGEEQMDVELNAGLAFDGSVVSAREAERTWNHVESSFRAKLAHTLQYTLVEEILWDLEDSEYAVAAVRWRWDPELVEFWSRERSLRSARHRRFRHYLDRVASERRHNNDFY